MGEPQAGLIRVPSMRRRFVAFVIDFFIASFLLTMGLGVYVTYVDAEAAGRGALLVLTAVALTTNVLPTAFVGGSLGQLACGLRVARLDGRRLSVPHTLARLVTFVFYFPWGAVLGGFIGLLAAWAAGATGDAVLAALIAGALFGFLAWIPMAIVSNALGLAAHDAISRSVVIRSGEARPFAATLVPRSANRPKRGWAGFGAFALAAYLVAASVLAAPVSPGDTAGADVVVAGTVYVPKGQKLSVVPVLSPAQEAARVSTPPGGQQLAHVPLPPARGASAARPPGLAAPAASWCSATRCDALAGARVRFVTSSRYGWQALADVAATAADAQGAYRMVLPARYAAAPAPTYVMATDPGERLAVIAEVGVNQQRPGVGITLDVDHSTTYFALLRCPGGGTLGPCGSSAGDPSAEQLEKAMVARFAEQGHAGYLQTPERTIEALVASPTVMAALEAGAAAGRVPPAAPAAIVAATRVNPPLVAVAGQKPPQPSAVPSLGPPAAVQQPPEVAAPPAAVQPRPSVATPATQTAPAGRPPTAEPGCPSVYDGTYIGQATYQVRRFVLVNGEATAKLDPPRALNLTVVFECGYIDVERRAVHLVVTAAGADHPYFGALGIVAAANTAWLPLDLPQAREVTFPGGGRGPYIDINFPNGTSVSLGRAVVPSFDASRIASELGAGARWSHSGTPDQFPGGVTTQGGAVSYLNDVTYLSWSLTKTAR